MRIRIVNSIPEELCSPISHLIGQEFDVVDMCDYASKKIVYIDCESEDGTKEERYKIFHNEYEVI